MNPNAYLRRIAAALFAVFILPALCCAALTWDNQRVELKVKPSDKEAIASFHFVNSGQTSVTIVHIQPSCGCTTAQLEKRQYAPGESGDIKAVFTIGDRVGDQEKTIFVTADDAPEKSIALTLHVTIPELLICTPRLLMWNVGDKPDAKPTAISSSTSMPITAVNITSPLSSEVAARIEVVEPGVRYHLFVSPVTTAAAMNAPVAGTATFADGTIQPFKIYALVR